MTWKILLCALLLLTPAAFALSVATDANSVSKGGSVRFFGTCAQGTPISVRATRESLLLFENSFACPSNGNWSVDQEIGFLMPTGAWTLRFGQGTEEKTVTLLVRPSRESSLLVIDFFNDLPAGQNRLEPIVLDLTLTDAGATVSDANMAFWDLAGKRVSMQNLGSGVYRGTLDIPLDAPLSDFNLVVVAERFVDTDRKGTEFIQSISIQPAQLRLLIQKPTRFSIEIGKPVEWVVAASYRNGMALEQGTVVLVLADANHVMGSLGNGVYSA
ncbi:MAG: hypothetical protein Q7R47_04245, partial [Candidatus Diapherotrites archaeon]|nr:hypothetical protein [Candidatus Diapherotrites archaeon]